MRNIPEAGSEEFGWILGFILGMIWQDAYQNDPNYKLCTNPEFLHLLGQKSYDKFVVMRELGEFVGIGKQVAGLSPKEVLGLEERN